jgi:Xaa-Pro aminopeptidase
MKRQKKQKEALMLWGATDFGVPHFSADILWRTGGFRVPDPVILVEIGGRAFLFVSSLEYNRARATARVDGVVLLDKNECLGDFLKKKKVTRIAVPRDFPYSLGKEFERRYHVVTRAGGEPFYGEREIKTRWELREISKAQRAVERSVGKAIFFLKKCRIRGKSIVQGKNRVVTSEMVRKIIDTDLYTQGYLGVRSIVASGKQGADPHAEGTGPLMAHAPIVMDVFPVSIKTHYWADMTRTVFKGEPSLKYKAMYNAVLQGQLRAIKKIHAGADGYDIWRDQVELLEQFGFPTRSNAKPPEGFFHGVGHGVGLDIHEFPHIGSSHYILQAGSVVTVEPGLYYTKARGHIPVGGIRIEDMVVVKKGRCQNLTKFPKRLEDIIFL